MTSTDLERSPEDVPAALQRFRFGWPSMARTPLVKLSLVGLVVLILVALFGRYAAPYSPTGLESAPYSPPSRDFLLGTDFLGRDVLSRVLYGGRSVILVAGTATILAYIFGSSIGLLSGYSRSWLDATLMRTMDVLLAFPPILFILVLAAGAGAGARMLITGIAIVHVPSIARVVRAAALDVSVHGYVEAAVARGDATRHILFREMLPNISGPVAADLGPRFTISILLVAAVNFLGLGLAPPSPDWAIAVAENRSGLGIQVWAVLGPAAMIAALTVVTNVVADATARSLGRNETREMTPP